MKPEEIMATLKECSEEETIEMEEAERARSLELIASCRSKALKVQLTPDESEFIQYMSAKLPPLIARAAVEDFFPGIIKRQTLAQADSAGLGPCKPWKVGRKVAYPTEELLLWMVGRLGISRLDKEARHIK
ncbi:hypothetical protein LJB86_05620 [Deltaproteobacteria bacterium OttesenSCG-928-M10]|nr:hypothetical protein [Deltaproteobacteria bacterium OttesenSCG-928-M10]